jgi:glycosyltransferase involved in cell wall biosynthesis
MIEGLRRAGLDVVECHASLWNSVEDRANAAGGGWRNPRFMWRAIKTYMGLMRRYFKLGDFDVMVVGYPGQFDVYLAWLLTRLRRRPLVWDIFMSIYLIALERSLEHQSHFTVNMIRVIERWACHLPDCLILDTVEYVGWFQRVHGVTTERFRLIPTGADDRVYRAVEVVRSDPRFTLIYYGSFIRNHGVPTMIEAAHLLRDVPEMRFVFIGDGPEKATALAMAQRYDLAMVEFVDWLESEELVYQVARADVCLGVFGTTPQSLMTVQNKIYEALAMRKPIITGDASAIHTALQHGEHVFLCERSNPQALAEAILTLKSDLALREKLAAQGHRLYFEQFDLAHTALHFAAVLRELQASCGSD